jgi:hypothetical protein
VDAARQPIWAQRDLAARGEGAVIPSSWWFAHARWTFREVSPIWRQELGVVLHAGAHRKNTPENGTHTISRGIPPLVRPSSPQGALSGLLVIQQNTAKIHRG